MFSSHLLSLRPLLYSEASRFMADCAGYSRGKAVLVHEDGLQAQQEGQQVVEGPLQKDVAHRRQAVLPTAGVAPPVRTAHRARVRVVLEGQDARTPGEGAHQLRNCATDLRAGWRLGHSEDVPLLKNLAKMSQISKFYLMCCNSVDIFLLEIFR